MDSTKLLQKGYHRDDGDRYKGIDTGIMGKNWLCVCGCVSAQVSDGGQCVNPVIGVYM